MGTIQLAERQPAFIPGFAAQAAAARAAPSAPARLSALEWSIVALAQGASLASLREPGRLATAFAGLIGRTSDRRLADSRLEALRRIAVLAWHHSWRVPTSEIRAFLNEGFSLDQYELVQISIGRARAQRRSRRAYS